jgi:hypothetical protein
MNAVENIRNERLTPEIFLPMVLAEPRAQDIHQKMFRIGAIQRQESAYAAYQTVTKGIKISKHIIPSVVKVVNSEQAAGDRYDTVDINDLTEPRRTKSMTRADFAALQVFEQIDQGTFEATPETQAAFDRIDASVEYSRDEREFFRRTIALKQMNALKRFAQTQYRRDILFIAHNHPTGQTDLNLASSVLDHPVQMSVVMAILH